MNQKLTRMLGIDFPLFAFTHCRDVVVAVSKAGGFGVFGAAMMDAEQLKIELDWIDAHIDGKPYGLDLAIPENMADLDAERETRASLSAKIPADYHAFVDRLLRDHDINPQTPVAFDEPTGISHYHDVALAQVAEGLRHPIRLLVNALGKPPEFLVDMCRDAGVPVGALIGSKAHALRQIEAGCDVLIAQGTEAAAHCGEVSTMVLLAEVVGELEKHGHDVPVLAAGGIATGRQMAGAMMMGAAGAWTGSVWLTTPESDDHPAVKEQLLAAQSRDTIRSRAMTGKTARQLRSAWNRAWEEPDAPKPLPMPFQHILAGRALQQAEKSVDGGNEKARAMLTQGVGQSIGLVCEQKFCRAVVHDFMDQFADAVDRMNQLTAVEA